MMGLLLSICVVAQLLSVHGDCKHCHQTLWSSFVFMVHETWTQMLHIGLVHYQGPDIGKMH